MKFLQPAPLLNCIVRQRLGDDWYAGLLEIPAPPERITSSGGTPSPANWSGVRAGSAMRKADIAMTLLLILFLVSGAILIGISIPLIQGRVGSNRLYGFRVRRTLEDPKVWYPVNAYAAWRLLGLGVAVMVVATALYFVPDIEVAVYACIVGGVAIAGVILGLVQSFRYLHQLTKENENKRGQVRF
jgi:hypothetical protein